MLDVLFTLKRRGDGVVRFKVYQCLDAVSFGETLGQALTVLVDTPHQIVCHADIQRSTGFTGEDVYPIGHFPKLMDCRIKPGNDELIGSYTRIGISTYSAPLESLSCTSVGEPGSA